MKVDLVDIHTQTVKKKLLIYGITWREPRNAVFMHYLSRYFDILVVTRDPLDGQLLKLAAPAEFKMEKFIFSSKIGFGFSPNLKRIARGFKPDVILSLETHSLAAYQSVRLAKELGIRSAVFTWQNVDTIPKYFIQKLPQQYVIRNADHFLAGSSDALRYLTAMGADRKKISVIPETGFDPRIFTQEGDNYREQWGFEKKDYVVLFAGRLVAEKGVDDILATVRYFSTRHNEIKFVFVGSGPLSDVVANSGLSNVSYKGRFNFVDMGNVMRSCDLFLYPSYSTKYWVEQFGYAPIEAIACGSPSIVSESGTLKQLIQPGKNGSIIPEHSVDGLQREISVWYEKWRNNEVNVDVSGIQIHRAENVAHTYFQILGNNCKNETLIQP
jgi:glycosyltransferase involved in cell wall biosynthesis